MTNQSDRLFTYVLDVENVLNLGWAYFLTHDVHGRVSRDGRISKELLKTLSDMEAPDGSADAVYLLQVKTIVMALGSALNDLEENHHNGKKSAQAYIEHAKSHLRETIQIEFLTNLVMRILAFGGLGVAVLGALGLSIQMHAEAKHTDAADLSHISLGTLSILGFFIFGAGQRVVQVRLNHFKEAKIQKRHDWMCSQAEGRWLHSQVKVLTLYRDRIVVLWEAYTGLKAPPMITLLSQAKEAMRAHDGEMREKRKMTSSLLQRAMYKFETWRERPHHVVPSNGTVKQEKKHA